MYQSKSILDRFLSAQAEVCINYTLWGKDFIYQNNKHASDTIKVLKKLGEKRNMNDEVRDTKTTVLFSSTLDIFEALGKRRNLSAQPQCS